MKSVILGMLLVLGTNLYAQPFSAEKIQSKLNTWAKEWPQEAVYLHLDKAIYLSGEDLWYAAYLVDHRTLLPAPLSGLLYIDLIDQKNDLIGTQRIPIVAGKGKGQLRLSRDLASGIYRLRAHTHWMRNEGRYFQTSLQILNPEDGATVNEEDLSGQPAKPDLQFLPEGGHLVAGLEQVVAVKALGTDGFGLDLQGRILDQHEEVVATFSTAHRGMGRFELLAGKNQVYQAEIEWEGRKLRYPLPKVADKGYSLTVKPGKIFNELKVQASPTFANSSCHLVGQVRGQPCVVLSFRLNGQSTSLNLPNYQIPTGILQLSLFSSAGELLAERLIFVRNEEAPQLKASLSADRLGKREAQLLHLSLHPEAADSGSAEVSVAVVDARTLWTNRPDRSNISSHFFLGSELTGFLEDPAFYLEYDHSGVAEATDLLLLTQGWRKPDWTPILKGNIPHPDHYIERGITLTGTVTNPKGKRVAGARINLIAGDLIHTYTAPTNDKGKFILAGLDYTDTTDLVLQTLNAKEKVRPYQVVFDSLPNYAIPASSIFRNRQFVGNQNSPAPGWLSMTQQQVANRDLAEGVSQFGLEEISIEARQKDEKEVVPLSVSYRNASYTLLENDIKYAANVLEALRGKVLGIQIRGNPGNYSVLLRGGLESQPLYLLNGMPTDLDVIEMVTISEVSRIDVLRGNEAAIYGVNTGNGVAGVISVFTKTGPDRMEEDVANEGIISLRLPGYAVVREFYAPRYEVDAAPQAMPDLRSTIYWNPSVKVASNGGVELDFYHSDVKGEFQVIVEGMTSEGEPIRATTHYHVE